MNPSEQYDAADLERRLREAFAAKALQVSDADLDHDREDEVAAALSSRHGRRPATRWFAGIGTAAAAAAIVGVTFVGLHGDGQRHVVNGLPPAVTTSSSTSAGTATTSSAASSAPTQQTSSRQPANPGSRQTSPLSTSNEPTTASSAPSSDTATAPEESRTAMSDGSGLSTAPTGSASSSMTLAAQQPPVLSHSLPQSKPLTDDREYAGAIPLEDPAGGATRMLSMPSGTTWQRTAEDASSLTVHITYLPTDLEAYWQQTLPGEGWVADGAGWKFPGTSYAVSAITDKGSFTVTW